MVAATVAPAATGTAEHRLTLYDVSWEMYEGLVALFAHRSEPRVTYNRGVLEIVSPLPRHEQDHLALAQVVAVVAEEMGLEYLPVGATTFRRAELEQGFEADSSFYLRNERFVLDREEIDPTVDPPPELVIEVDPSHSSLDKLGIYAAFGVPEVWHCRGDSVVILVLESGIYRESASSRLLPLLTAEALSRFLVESRSLRRLAWLRGVRSWVRGRSGDGAEPGHGG